MYEFHGPGLPLYANGVHTLQPLNDWAKKCCSERDLPAAEANAVLRLLEAAFEAGRNDAKREIREIIGV